MRYLVDSNIIIYHLNREPVATDFLAKEYRHIAISQITFIEVLSFSFSDKEESDVRKLLNTFKIIDIDTAISNQAIENRKQKKIKVPDNIILSTAMVHGLTLVTKNTKDFNAFDIKLLDPFEDIG